MLFKRFAVLLLRQRFSKNASSIRREQSNRLHLLWRRFVGNRRMFFASTAGCQNAILPFVCHADCVSFVCAILGELSCYRHLLRPAVWPSQHMLLGHNVLGRLPFRSPLRLSARFHTQWSLLLPESHRAQSHFVIYYTKLLLL